MCDDEWMWSTLLDKCNKIYKERGQGIRIPDTIAPDPVDVFDQTGVDKNVFRFVIYICWLQKQPDAFRKYLSVREKRFHDWLDCVYKVWQI